MPLVYDVLPVHPCVALPETRVVVDVPLLEPKITNWPEELIDHVSPVTFIPTPDKVPLALKVRVPPVTVKLFPLNIAVVKTLPETGFVTGTNVKVAIVPFVYDVLPVHPCVALPETRVVVDVPLLEPRITNWPEELIDHVSPVTFTPTPDSVPSALKVRVPPVTVKLLPLSIAVVKTLPAATGVNVKVSVVPYAYATLPVYPFIALPLMVIVWVPLLEP